MWPGCRRDAGTGGDPGNTGGAWQRCPGCTGGMHRAVLPGAADGYPDAWPAAHQLQQSNAAKSIAHPPVDAGRWRSAAQAGGWAFWRRDIYCPDGHPPFLRPAHAPPAGARHPEELRPDRPGEHRPLPGKRWLPGVCESAVDAARRDHRRGTGFRAARARGSGFSHRQKVGDLPPGNRLAQSAHLQC